MVQELRKYLVTYRSVNIHECEVYAYHRMDAIELVRSGLAVPKLSDGSAPGIVEGTEVFDEMYPTNFQAKRIDKERRKAREDTP